ncbi:MAG: sulfatase-like hydrolase/transferase [Planctomycetaceae bacterium]|nr:sulfatase-like hydrolase/transferase [Planctomycetaceae bacterium]
MKAMPVSSLRIVVLACLLVVTLGFGAYRWLSQSPRPNIILVTFDTTRADHIGAYGYEHGLTTAFDQFAGEGVLFEKAYAPCPITLPSHATMLTGLYPPEHDLRVNGSGSLSSDIPFLPEILNENGYETGAFIAAPPVLGAQFGLDRGFDTYDDERARSTARTRPFGGERRDGEEVVDLALKWLQERDSQPFFCWIHLYDAHGPYDPYLDVFGERFEENPYDAGVAWEIRQFERVLAYLKDRELDSETLVVVAGDHGEGLNDHGEHEHGMLVYNSTLHVPVVFRGPQFCQPGTRVESAVSLVDLFPTLLEILKIPAPEHVSGRSLVPALQGQAIESRDCYAEAELPYFLNRWCPLQSVISDDWKYIESTRPELYDLKQDPDELKNLINTSGDEMQRLQSLLVDLQESFRRTLSDQVSLTDQDVANLKSLGYAAGGTSSNEDGAIAGEELIDVKDMISHVAKYEEAKHLVSANRLDEAIAMLQKVADATDEFPMSDLRLADLLAETGRPQEALAIYRSVISRRPDFTAAWFSLGRLLASLGEFEQLEEHFRGFVEAHPADPAGHFELARVLVRLKKPSDAIREFEETLRLAPEMVDAYVSLGQLLVALKQPAEAVAYLERALDNNPKHVAANENLMMVFAQTGQLDRAIQIGKQVVTMRPDSFETRFNLGLILIQDRQFAEGIAQLGEAQRIRPDDPRPTQHIKQARAASLNSDR